MKPKTKPISLYIDEQLKEELTKEAKSKCLSLNAYIRLILCERKK